MESVARVVLVGAAVAAALVGVAAVGWFAFAWWLEAGPEPYDAWAGDYLVGGDSDTDGAS